MPNCIHNSSSKRKNRCVWSDHHQIPKAFSSRHSEIWPNWNAVSAAWSMLLLVVWDWLPFNMRSTLEPRPSLHSCVMGRHGVSNLLVQRHHQTKIHRFFWSGYSLDHFLRCGKKSRWLLSTKNGPLRRSMQLQAQRRSMSSWDHWVPWSWKPGGFWSPDSRWLKVMNSML